MPENTDLAVRTKNVAETWNQIRPAALKPCIAKWRVYPMIQWILILLIVAAVAGLLGFGRLSGAALTGAKFLVGLVLILFLLAVLGIVAIA